MSIHGILTSRDVVSLADLQGLDEALIVGLEADQGVRFPAAYREFLGVAGAGAGRLWVGSDAFYPSLAGIKRDALALVRANGGAVDLERAVVILLHQGYQFLYLPADGDDPPVLQWIEGNGLPVAIAPTFSSLLERSVAEI